MRVYCLRMWTNKMKQRFRALYATGNVKFQRQFGFEVKDATLDKLVDYMHAPKDSSSLAITRILFGLAMLFDIPDERGGAIMDRRWGDPKTCHFPLFPFLQPVLLPYMALVYAAMWFGALGIMLGYKYRISACTFTVSYWYLFLIEKSFWNNHTYLFGIIGFLLTFTDANCYWSIDAYVDPSKRKETVPYWNYFVLKYQFFILYFMAGMKKGTAEWLTGYSVQNLSEHWVFDPFKWFLTESQTNYLVVHWFVFIFDLTVAIWMMWSYSRDVAMVFCALFHLMNSRLFRIGMFPWVCLATMPLFYPFDWPKTVMCIFGSYYKMVMHRIQKMFDDYKVTNIFVCKFNENHGNIVSDTEFDQSEDVGYRRERNADEIDNSQINEEEEAFNGKCEENNENEQCAVGEMENRNGISERMKKRMTIYFIIFHVLTQPFLPFSHFITKGYNNWTNGLYGYSWDMMVHTWDVRSVTVKVTDNDNKREMYIDPYMHALNERWTRHGDMALQYAKCVQNSLEGENYRNQLMRPLSKNISIYIDVWYSLNGRFVQRMFDPTVDLLQVSWSPLRKVSFLMPLLDEAVHWRRDLDKIKYEVHSWSNSSDVAFFADFPGYYHEKYIPLELQNVTLFILEGKALYEPEVTSLQIGQSYKLEGGDRIRVTTGAFHKVWNIGKEPVFYMYTFFNKTEMDIPKDVDDQKSKLPIFKELYNKVALFIQFATLIIGNVFQIFNYSQCSNVNV